MNFYEVIDGKITVFNSDGCRPHWLNCNQTEEEIVRYEGQLMLKSEFEALSQTPEYIAEQERKEQERIQELTISKTDLFKAIYLSKGLTPQDIRGRIELITDEQQRVLALIDFDNAKDFYRKHPLFGDFALSLGFSKEDIDAIFINGNEVI